MKNIFYVILPVFCLLLSTPSAEAILLSVDDPIFGVDSITRDTDTGLEWLDMDLSAGSYNDLIGLDGTNEFIPGGDFAGFRFANESEVESLWRNSGIVDINRTGNILDYKVSNGSGVRNLIGFLDEDRLSDRIPAIIGFISDPNPDLTNPLDRRYARVELNFSQVDNAEVGAVVLDGTYSEGDRLFEGNWLVRQSSAAIPEPATMVLFGSGILGFGLKRRVFEWERGKC